MSAFTQHGSVMVSNLNFLKVSYLLQSWFAQVIMLTHGGKWLFLSEALLIPFSAIPFSSLSLHSPHCSLLLNCFLFIVLSIFVFFSHFALKLFTALSTISFLLTIIFSSHSLHCTPSSLSTLFFTHLLQSVLVSSVTLSFLGHAWISNKEFGFSIGGLFWFIYFLVCLSMKLLSTKTLDKNMSTNKLP